MNALERYPHEFSGGQRQRIALARVLMLERQVIVAGAPSARSDVSIRSQVLNLMKPQLRSFGLGHVAACHFPLQTPVAA
jgi:ABC-type oligopeptide transport system ATPase subunit